ncbi:unnamed protein product [Sphagnum jensenii]|uniref:DUF4220 domain-containing protein n=1 Tax=Sphagnum jensenii TaxID=128206 RepID=A0ABP0WRG7_9BRYO
MVLQTWRTVSARHEPQKPIRVLANGAGSVTSAPCSPDPGIFHVLDDEIIPATGLLLSLFFQLLMLITGWLRKRTSKASTFAWTAYVSADILVFYLLGLLTRTQSHTEVYGLWSALLIYHLGGPDNFTAYERADSELWMRHLLSLLQQVGTAAYVIAVNTRGWLLTPTLIVLFIGVYRYWERNSALRHSSRRGINRAVSPLYFYMMHGLQERRGKGPDGIDMLEFLVAGSADWMQKLRLGQPREHPNIVTTGEIERDLKFSTPALTDWALRLTVASATAFAYLRRLISLARFEQFQKVSPMRNLWFETYLQDKRKWLPYLHLEQNFLYDLLYTKPVDSDRHLLLLLLRMLSSLGLVAALFITFWHASEKTWDGHASYKVTTYIVLAVGCVVEIAYFIRLVCSKGAVVAMLVAQVRTKRRLTAVRSRAKKIFLSADLSINRFFCEKAMRITMFLEENIILTRLKISYIPPPNRSLLVRMPLPCVVILRTIMAFPRMFLKLSVDCLGRPGIDSGPSPDRGWEMLSWTFPDKCDIGAEFRKIQACQDDAVAAIFEPLLYITHAEDRYSQRAGVPSALPLTSESCCDIIYPFYKSDWEHILIIFWLATLKILKIENDLSSRDGGTSISPSDNRDQSQLPPESSLNAADLENQTRLAADSTLELVERTQRSGESDAAAEIQPNDQSNETESNENSDPECRISADTAELADRNQAVWQMLYVSRLLTVRPQLLPTQLDLTKEIVEENLRAAESDIKNPSNWLKKTKKKVSELGEPRKLGEIKLSNGNMAPFSAFDPHLRNHSAFLTDCQESSSQLAVLLLKLDAARMWEVLKKSACWFIASLAQSNKVEEHCAMLRDGGELLTTLWILSSDLGGGAQY